MLIALDILMVLAGLAGGLSEGRACFLMWVLGCVFFLPIVYDLAFTFRTKAAAVGDTTAATYTKLMGLTIVLWVFYPIVFYFCEYLNAWSTTTEILAYGILDVTAKCVFGFILLSSRDTLEQVSEGYQPVA
jgi:bacteriorhodopsin